MWPLRAKSVSLVRSALGGGSDCRGPMVVRREKKEGGGEEWHGLSGTHAWFCAER